MAPHELWHKLAARAQTQRGRAAAAAGQVRRAGQQAAARLRAAQARTRARHAWRRLRDLAYLLRLERTVTFFQLVLGYALSLPAGQRGDWGWLAAVVACLGPGLYGGLYALNDAHDWAEDRLNPRKRDRPVAAGRISPRLARRLGLALVGLGLAGALALGPRVFVLGLALATANLLYTHRLKRLPGLELAGNAATHVLRLAGGMWLAGGWSHGALLLAWGLPAVALSALKRHHELATGPVGARPVLARYSAAGLERLMAGCFWLALAIWTRLDGVDFAIGAVGLVATLGLVHGYQHVPAVRRLEDVLWR